VAKCLRCGKEKVIKRMGKKGQLEILSCPDPACVAKARAEKHKRPTNQKANGPEKPEDKKPAAGAHWLDDYL
jgi:hypothetical protein